MKRVVFLLLAALAGLSLIAPSASAQVYVRAPFVRVQVGGPGVYVRAPFVNLGFPSDNVYYMSPPAFIGPPPAPQGELLPPPTPVKPLPADPDLAPPAAAQAPPPTLEEFAKSFQAKPGNYEVTLLNPVTRQPTTVRFTLPAGTPRRVNLSRRELEFDYGPRRYVQIEFDRDGVEVRTRDR